MSQNAWRIKHSTSPLISRGPAAAAVRVRQRDPMTRTGGEGVVSSVSSLKELRATNGHE